MQALILTHARHEGPGHFGDALRDAGVASRTFALPEGPGAGPVELPDAREADLILALGGPAAADDDAGYPWLAQEAAFLGQAAREGRKVLGICLGSQILARGLGGTVRRGAAVEIGFGDVELTDEGGKDPVLAALRSPETVLHWHSDAIEAPPESVRLAVSERAPVQAFRHGRHAYGIQFHLEVGREGLEEWLAVPSVRRQLESAPGGPSPEALLAEAAERDKRLAWLCSSIINRLVNLI